MNYVLKSSIVFAQIVLPLTLLFFFCYTPRAWGILVPWPGINPRPKQWKCQALTAGPPGNYLDWVLFFFFNLFLVWTIYKVFIEFVTILLLLFMFFFFFLDLSSPTRDQTLTLYIGRQSPNHWTIGEVLVRRVEIL